MDWDHFGESDDDTEDTGTTRRYRRDGEGTDTIDLNRMLTVDLTKSGSFDLSKVNEASFGKLLQSLSVPTLLVARSHAVEFANSAFSAITKGGSDFRSFTFSSLFRNPKEAREAQLLLEKVFKDRKPRVKERILQIFGTRMWARIHLRTIRLGNEQLVLVQLENLTAQKQLRTIQKYKKLMNIFPMGIAELALHRSLDCSQGFEDLLEGVQAAMVIDGNNEFARMYNRESIEDMLGMTLGTLFPSTGKRRKIYEAWIMSGFPVHSFDSREKLLSISSQYFENTFIGNVSKDRLLGFWWLKRDISEKRRAEEELLRAQNLESLGLLAGGIAHDFNNLLTGVMGNISLALGYLNPDHKAYTRLQAAVTASSRAGELTRQLLTFSQGGAPVKKTSSIRELLTDSVMFALRGSKTLSRFSIPEDLWHIDMDAGQVHQVINNLVINAVQAMPDGGTLEVEAENMTLGEKDALPIENGRYVRIAVRDTGMGIPREYLQKIFDPYFTTKKTGTGLGLATSYSVVRKHGGLMTVESEVGVGSAFHFYLPASRRMPESPGETEELDLSGTGMILVMDDDDLIRDLAGELLSMLGYETAFAGDGKEAVRIYREGLESQRPFDAVIMDLTIPGGMGGRETIAELRRIDPNVKAVVSSGYSNDPIMAEYESHGFVGVLPKPYDVREVSRLLRRILSL
ncbi:MAG: ATP-binding protein [Desulfomonilaceae bacterium]|nr:ATP-binding protein [Desulfomonilaceae bacterium]